MANISWCFKKGARLIEPSEYRCKDYLNRAEEDILSMQSNKGHWKLITAYYACYDALYALLMKIGMKSEVHDCSIAFMQMLDFEGKDIDFIKKLKEERIQVQYYLKEIPLNQEDEVKSFVLNAKEKINRLNKEGIDNIRSKIRSMAR